MEEEEKLPKNRNNKSDLKQEFDFKIPGSNSFNMFD